VQQVTGGNNQLTGHPGNPNSSLWIKGQGVRATFRVPLDPNVRHDCFGDAAGLGVKMIFTGTDGNPSGYKLFAGVHYVNYSTGIAGDPYHYEEPVWGALWGTKHDDDDWQDSPGQLAAGYCHLIPGQLVTLRIRPVGTNGFQAECLAGSAWYSMMPNNVYIPPPPTGTGVSLLEHFRLGGQGGLSMSDVSNLQELNLASPAKWIDWDNANCWLNNSDDYFFDGAQTSFKVYPGTPNGGC
jgi:hypothetical protein